jgi:hypothetical protein
VDEAHISEFDVVADTLRVKAREKSGRRRAVKAFVVEKDPDFQESSWLAVTNISTEPRENLPGPWDKADYHAMQCEHVSR